MTGAYIKRDTNEWKSGMSWTMVPNCARETQPTVRRANGTVYRNYDKNSNSGNVYLAWLGGSLIKDKLISLRSASSPRPPAPRTAARARPTQQQRY